MKQRIKKLSFNKETLLNLTPRQLNRVAGGAAAKPSDVGHAPDSLSLHEQPPIIVEVSAEC